MITARHILFGSNSLSMKESITECFKSIVAKQKSIGYEFPSLLRPGTERSSLAKVEETLGLKFNDELIELYTFADGIKFQEGSVIGKSGIIPIHVFLSNENAINYYKTYITHEDLFTNHDSEKSPGKKLFPFLEDSAGCCHWVDLNDTKNHGKIYWTNSYGESPDYVFSSLTKFFQAIKECYEKEVFFLDEDGYLEQDDEEFARVAMKLDPKIKYWKEFLEDEE
jgi:hypothetical protein